jgi:uncharacterized protein YndB with AHSA1/START domain
MNDTGKLKLTTPGEREVVMTREFDAPRELVFEAWTRPELLKRWLYGPEEWRLRDCEIDLRVGGAYRFVWGHRDGKDKGMGMSGVYREIARSERLVFTEVWDDDWTGGEAVVTIVFTERAGKTTLTQTVAYSSRAAREGVLKTDMERGVAISYDRLAELLASEGARGLERGA